MQSLFQNISYMARSSVLNFQSMNSNQLYDSHKSTRQNETSCVGTEQIFQVWSNRGWWFGDYSLELGYLNCNPISTIY